MCQRMLLICLTVATALVACSGNDAVPPEEALQVSEPRLVLPPPGAENAAAYMRLHNAGEQAVELGQMASPAYARVELHDMIHGEDGMMRMRRIDDLRIAPGETVALAPHERHLMLMGPTRAPQPGDVVALTLRYRVAEAQYTVALSVPAEAR